MSEINNIETRKVPRPAGRSATNLPTDIVDGRDPIEREAYEWVARFIGGELSPQEIEAMKAWYGQSPAHAAAYAKVRRVWHAMGPAATAVVAQNGNAGRTNGQAAVAAPSFVSRRAIMAGGLAAAAAGYFAIYPPLDLWPSYAELMADYRTGIGERRQVTLADAVSLDLNTRTSIAIGSQSADAARIRLIAGELSVSTPAAISSLTVIAGEGRVVATKANFNLRCDSDEVRVSCLQGAVNVERGGVTVSLTGGQQVAYDAQAIRPVTTIDPDHVTAWQRGMLIFDATPVAQVIEEANRYRSGRIVLMNSEIGRRRLSAQLRITDVDKIVGQIVHIFGAKATPLPGGIVVLT
jgi:transmembrane sensor